MFGVRCKQYGFWGFRGTLRLLEMGKRCVMLVYNFLTSRGEPYIRCDALF